MYFKSCSRRGKTMQMADILRKNCVALIGTLRKQEYLCDLLVSRRVLSEEDRDEVLCEKTNSRKNRLLLDLIRCRFTRAFPVFCEGLRTTQQFDLLQLLDPARAFDNVPEEPNRSTECKIGIAFQPCKHVCLDSIIDAIRVNRQHYINTWSKCQVMMQGSGNDSIRR